MAPNATASMSTFFKDFGFRVREMRFQSECSEISLFIMDEANWVVRDTFDSSFIIFFTSSTLKYEAHISQFERVRRSIYT
ncbi:hypothetical protein Sjap_014836 [Stephania japonica]|uniref:Uncharacterized protein n=1 Tax=Stephania japonica TaxID=461633 RepID=A0AAP0II07_9MAGN